MKNLLQRMFLVGAFAIVGIIVTQTTAMSQEYVCIIVDGCKYLITYDPCGNIIAVESDCGSKGKGVFAPARAQGQNQLENDDDGIPPEGPLDVSLTPVAISTDVQDPALGTVTTFLDEDRPSPPTTIISNNPDERFPATVTIQFYAKAKAKGLGDKVFSSREPLVFVSDNVNSVNPFENEDFTLANDVDFYDPNSEAKNTAFRLKAGETTVTLGADEERDDDDLH